MAWKVKQETAANAEMKNIESSIKQVEGDREKYLYSLGLDFYNENKNSSDLNENYKQKIDAINKLDYNRKVWINRKMKLQGMRICEGCGNVLPYESFFCNRCGVKLGAVAEELVIIPALPEE